jgi:hypothetical protein
MKIHSMNVTLMLLLAASAQAQQAKPQIVAEGGGPDDRASARVLYWNQQTNSSAGWLSIDYGRPRWKKEYDDPAKFDAMTKGKVWRMGSNHWTTLDTCLPLRIAGQDVAVGSYYLGLHRSADGSSWSLAFIDPAGVRRTHLDAFEIQKASVGFEAPMTIEKAQAVVDKLTITLSYPQDNPRKATLKVTWGNLALNAPVEVALPQ